MSLADRPLLGTGERGFALRLATGCVATALLLAAAGTHSTRDRPPPAHTGGFNEPTCQSCHFDGDLNDGPGSLSIEGLPDRYAAGQTYVFALVLTDPDLAAGGFQIAVRFEDGRQAGSLHAKSKDADRVEVTTQAGVQYAHHGPAGIIPAPAGTHPAERGTMRWLLLWTAPDESADIVIHAIGNAADNDDSPLGDRIYTAVQRLQAQQ